jgi:L-ascorbate metabolism protein UlaG (beta-lactamase superfamily)
MQRALLLLFLAISSAEAGLERYRDLVVADAARKPTLRGGVRVTYLGTNGYQFETGDHALLIDPYFSRVGLGAVIFGTPIQPNGQRINEALQQLAPYPEAILVTHGHVDHLLDAPPIMKLTGARLIASRTATQLAQAAGASPAQCDAVTAGDVRRIGPWKIHVLGATHDRVFPIGVPFAGSRKEGAPRKASDWVCGEPLAFLIEIHGKRIYLDAGGTPALLPPANIGPVDLAILGVALPDSRTRFSAAVRRLRPRYVLPSHQDDFFRPLNRGFAFGPLTDFPRVRQDFMREKLPGRLILLDYFRPWTLP